MKGAYEGKQRGKTQQLLNKSSHLKNPPEQSLEITEPAQTDMMHMPLTSDEDSTKNLTKTDVNTVYYDEEVSHLAQMSGADHRQDALGSVIQNTITADSASFPQFIIQSLQQKQRQKEKGGRSTVCVS